MDRKMNPLKLMDAAASSFSGMVKKTASSLLQGPSVSERIAGLRGKDAEAETDDAAAGLRLDQLRIALTTENVTDADGAVYTLSLVDKKTNQTVSACERKWSEFEPTLQFLRSLYPKLEVPAPPLRPSGRAAAVVVEERRKYVQAFLNVCAAHAGASKTKELQQLVGLLGGPTGASPQAASPSPAKTPGRPRSDSEYVRQPSEQSVPNDSFNRAAEAAASPQSNTARQVKFAAPDQPSKPPTPPPSPATQKSVAPKPSTPTPEDDRVLIDEVFHIVDVDNSGYVTEDELKDFIEALPKHVSTRAVKQAFQEADSGGGAFDAKSFRVFITRLSQVTRVGVEDMWRVFRRRKLSELYESITDAGYAKDHEIDRDEIKPLLAVLQTGGLRQLSAGAVQSVDFAIPYTYAEYEDVMELLLRVIPAPELFKAVRISSVSEGGQTLSIINRHVGKAPGPIVRQLKELVARYGGTSCSNCAAVQAKCDAVEQAMRALKAEKDALAAQLQAATARNTDAAREAQRALEDTKSKDKAILELNDQIGKLKQEVIEATAAKEALVHKVCEVEAELSLEQDEAKKRKKAGRDDFEYATDSDMDSNENGSDEDEGDAAAVAAVLARKVNMHFLMPAHLGSHDAAPVVDRPGALVYDIAASVGSDAVGKPYLPMGFATDLYIADSSVNEYLALRTPEEGGSCRRSLAWSIVDGHLCCGWAGRRALIPQGRWVRIGVKLRWDEATFDVSFDGTVHPELNRVPFRDGALAAAGGAGTLDVFPRDVVAVYYANMHFFR
jgi:hypothetical protein